MIKKTLRWALAVVVGGGVFYFAVAAVGLWLTTRTDRSLPRDPKTGILAGAEPRELGPDSAEGAVLLVNGFLGTPNNFADLPERIANADWRVRTMLLPGHGTSPRDLDRTSALELVQAVEDEAAELKEQYGRVVLLGHSMGGAICTIVAAEQQVDGLILAAPYFSVTYHWYYGLEPETWTDILGFANLWLYKGQRLVQVRREEVRSKIQSYQWVSIRSLQTLTEIGREASAPATLGQVVCPVLLVHANGDRAASPNAAKRAVELMGTKSKRSVWLENSNHIVFWDNDREQATKEVLGFLKLLHTDDLLLLTKKEVPNGHSVKRGVIS